LRFGAGITICYRWYRSAVLSLQEARVNQLNGLELHLTIYKLTALVQTFQIKNRVKLQSRSVRDPKYVSHDKI